MGEILKPVGRIESGTESIGGESKSCDVRGTPGRSPLGSVKAYNEPSEDKSRDVKERYPTYSISRLEVYKNCPKHFELKYVLRIKPKRVLPENALVGSLVHSTIENFYLDSNWRDKKPKDFFRQALIEVLVGNELIDKSEIKLVDGVIDYANRVQDLYRRASSDYLGGDPIRNLNGGISYRPTQTNAWKKGMSNLGLVGMKEAIDNLFRKRSPILEASITEAAAKALWLIIPYEHYNEIEDVVSVEFPFSELTDTEIVNPVSLEPLGIDGYYFQGYADCIAKVGGKLAILDHKTSVNAPNKEQVSYHVQLMAYAWAFEQLKGEKVSYIGIDHVKSRKLILSEVTPERDDILRAFFSTHASIQKGSFDVNLSKCDSWFGNRCPYYNVCHQ